MTTTLFQPKYLLGLPRPDRLFQRLSIRQRPPQIDRVRAASILDAYSLGILGEVGVPSGPGRSQNLIFETAAGKKMLKRYKSVVGLEAVRHEHSILQRLAELDFPAPRLSVTTAGETLVQDGDGYYALFDFLEGYFQYHNYLYLPAQTRRFVTMAGATLGALHSALEDFTPAGRNPNGFKSRDGERWRELDWFAEKLELCRHELPALGLHNFAERASWVEENLRGLDARLTSAQLPRLIIHGDYGPYNLLFKRGAPVVVLDFEIARLDWRLTDLPKALGFFAWDRMGFSARRAICFLEGYLSHCPIGDAELRLLPDVWQFLNLRRLIVCWHRYSTTRASQWLVEARRRSDLAGWLVDHQGSLSRLI
jgi:Ser/Thr protein kinase RdoA (MazF antagonist)